MTCKYFWLVLCSYSLAPVNDAIITPQVVEDGENIDFDDVSELTREQVQLLLNMSKKFKVLLQRERELDAREAEVRRRLHRAEELDRQTQVKLKQVEKVRAQLLTQVNATEQKQAEVYKKMQTDQAVKCLTCLDVVTVCRLLRLMPTKTQALILSRMPRPWKRKVQEEWGMARQVVEQA